jgi:hypothetical protein
MEIGVLRDCFTLQHTFYTVIYCYFMTLQCTWTLLRRVLNIYVEKWKFLQYLSI